eukprot:gene5954-6897_t
MFQEYVAHHNPHYTPDQIASVSSQYKSISDSLPYATYFFFGPLIGSLADRFGRKPIFYFVVLINLIDLGSLLICFDRMILIPFYITHALGGLGINCMTPIVFSYLADFTPQDKRPVWFGIAACSFGLSITVGPIVGMFLMEKKSNQYVEGVYVPTKVNAKSTVNPFLSMARLFTTSKYVGFYALLYFSFSYTSMDIYTTSFNYTFVKFGWGFKQNGITTSISGPCLMIWSAVFLPIALRFTNPLLLKHGPSSTSIAINHS